MRAARRRFLAPVFAALLGAAIAGCGASSDPTSSVVAAMPATAPHIVMTDALSGFAVWPSGERWILLSTNDGWRTIGNRTPIAVPTDGGLVVAADQKRLAVGVLPYESLKVSPVMQAASTVTTWTASQLPSALLPTNSSLASSQSAVWAVLDDGTVVSARDGTRTWRTVTTSRGLDPSGQITVTGVSFPDAATGFITASGPASRPVLFTTVDGGRSWAKLPLPVSGDGSATALAPCRVGSTWVASVYASGRLLTYTAKRASGPWISGPDLAATSLPLLACGPDRVWVVAPQGSASALYVAHPGESWADSGRIGTHAVSLVVTSIDQGFAATGEPELLSVRLGASPLTSPVPLPDWVPTVGGGVMRN